MAAATIAAFMSFLDITVTNASLPQIQGSIGASGTEGTWVGTAYLAAEVVMIPLTAWFGRLLGLRLYLTSAVILFTVFSVVCGFSGNLTQIIIGRVGQGFAGGALIPAGLTIAATYLTPAQKAAGLSVYATVTVLAPVLGPPLGGWLTENLSWHWIFFINIPLGAMLITMTMLGLDKEPIRREELARADWIGITGLAAALASLTIVLEEGQRQNWFESNEIIYLTLLALAGFALILWSQIRTDHPVLKLRLLRSRSFAATIICAVTMGGAPFAVVYLIPTFLGAIAGYNAQQTGIVSVYSGITSFLFMPLFAFMLTRVDIRWMVGSGILLYAIATLMDVTITAESVGLSFLVPQLIRGGAQMMATLPLSQAATANMPPEDIADGAALFTVARNLGGSTSLALIGVLIDRRVHFHTQQLGEAITANSLIGQQRISDFAGGLIREGADAGYAHMQALRMIGGEMQRQALVMAYADAFWIIGIGMIISLPAVFFIRQKLGAGGPAAH
jgi:DHA2 family multidrug resistance protein